MMIKAQGKDGKAKKQGPKNADEDAKVYHGEYHDHSFLRDIPEHDALLRRTYGAGFGTIHSPRERSNAESSSPPGIHNDEQTFPFQLHYMLSELERDGLGHIVSWQPHGRAFLVHDKERFTNEILPMWFRQNKYTSFQRQANLYNFKRITSGRDRGAYYHELFLRGKRFLCQYMKRTTVKGTGGRKRSAPESEPDLYVYPPAPLDDGQPPPDSAVPSVAAAAPVAYPSHLPPLTVDPRSFLSVGQQLRPPTFPFSALPRVAQEPLTIREKLLLSSNLPNDSLTPNGYERAMLGRVEPESEYARILAASLAHRTPSESASAAALNAYHHTLLLEQLREQRRRDSLTLLSGGSGIPSSLITASTLPTAQAPSDARTTQDILRELYGTATLDPLTMAALRQLQDK